MSEFTLYTLVYLMSEALGTYAVYKLIKSCLGGRKVRKLVELLSFAGYYLAMVVVYLVVNIPISNLVLNFIVIFLLALMYESSIKKKILTDILICVFMVGAEMIIVTLTGYIDFPIAERNDFDSIFGIVVINVLKYAVSMAVSGFKNIKIGNTLPEVYWISLFLIPISSLFMLVTIFQSTGLLMYQIAVSIIAVLIINFTVFFLFDRVARLYQEKQEKGLIEQQNKYYENQLQIINETQEASNILRHDMKNHLRSLFSDIKSGNLSEAQKHISDIVDVFESGTEIIDTGYPSIDSLVNFKLQAAKQNGVRVSVNASLPSDLNLSSFDMTVILGNLLDNALQAVSHVTEIGFIDFAIHYSKGMLLIKAANPFKIAVKREKEKIVTSKADRDNHGYGLRSVNEAVEKYNGTIEIETDDNIFTITAILYVE